MTDNTDEQIAVAVLQGDVEAFAFLVERYEAKLLRYARKFLSVSEDREDLVQDVFIKAYENLQSFNPSLRFSPWIYRIAHNVFVNELRRKSRYSPTFFDADVVLPFLPAKETADGEALASEEREQLDLALDKLKPKYREAVILHYHENLSYQEISDILKIPVTTVGVRISRARAKLKDIMQENE